MKTVPLRNIKQELSSYVDYAQKEFVLVTRHGRPAAIVLGVEGRDFEDIFYMTNRGFWSTIRRRRLQKPIPWRKAKRFLRSI